MSSGDDTRRDRNPYRRLCPYCHGALEETDTTIDCMECGAHAEKNAVGLATWTAPEHPAAGPAPVAETGNKPDTRRISIHKAELTRQSFQRCVDTRSHLTSIDQWRQISGVPRQTFYNVYRSNAVPSVVVALKIARSGGATVEDLFGHLTEPDSEENQ